MRLTLESTSEVGTLTIGGADVPARFWIGTTQAGNRVAAFITRVAPLSAAAALELETALCDATTETKVEIEGEGDTETGPAWEAVSEPGVVDMDELVTGRRVVKPYDWFRLVIDAHMVWIEPRPRYCDRGRYSGNYEGTFFIDANDSFPRYYMDLETAKREMKAWLLHRIECERRDA